MNNLFNSHEVVLFKVPECLIELAKCNASEAEAQIDKYQKQIIQSCTLQVLRNSLISSPMNGVQTAAFSESDSGHESSHNSSTDENQLNSSSSSQSPPIDSCGKVSALKSPISVKCKSEDSIHEKNEWSDSQDDCITISSDDSVGELTPLDFLHDDLDQFCEGWNDQPTATPNAQSSSSKTMVTDTANRKNLPSPVIFSNQSDEDASVSMSQATSSSPLVSGSCSEQEENSQRSSYCGSPVIASPAHWSYSSPFKDADTQEELMIRDFADSFCFQNDEACDDSSNSSSTDGVLDRLAEPSDYSGLSDELDNQFDFDGSRDSESHNKGCSSFSG